jgi:hypothetical protein
LRVFLKRFRGLGDPTSRCGVTSIAGRLSQSACTAFKRWSEMALQITLQLINSFWRIASNEEAIAVRVRP